MSVLSWTTFQRAILALFTGCCLLVSHSFAGTGDLGGADGIDYKLYEHNIKDPTTLPAYKLIQDLPIIQIFFGMRNWYIAPVTLQVISNQILGLKFIAEESQQFALQNSRAVWIDSRYFDKMLPEAQAYLILHEVIMTAYTHKFLTLTEQCLLLKGPKECKIDPSIEVLLPPTPFSGLTPDDYENIRTMTHWAFTKGHTATVDEFMYEFYRNHFDDRFFNPERYHYEKKPEVKIGGDTFYKLLKKADAVGLFSEKCHFVSLNEEHSCTLTLKESTKTVNATVTSQVPNGPEIKTKTSLSLSGLEIVIRDEKGRTLASTYFSKMGNYYSTLVHDVRADEDFYVIPVANWSDTPKERDLFYTTELIFKKNRSGNLEFDGFMLIPGVIWDITVENGAPICSTAKPKPTLDIRTSAVVMTHSPQHLPYLKFMSDKSDPAFVCR